MLEKTLNVTTWRQISEGIFGYKPKVTSIFGAPIGISEGTVFVDIDTDTYGVADNGDKIRTSEVNNAQENGKDSNSDKENRVDHNPVKDFMLYSGFVGSYLESFVLEETVGVFAVSTMEVFKVALSRGMELVKIDSQNSDELEKIKADDKTLSEMKNAVKAGRTIIVPREEMCYYGWKGTAYIALDTSTGEGAYMISGSMCGGSTAINIIVGTINVIIAAYNLIAAIDMIILGLANPVLLTVALVFLGVAVYAYIDSMFTLFMYCSTGEERYGEEMMTNLYFNVTFSVITKVAGTLGKKVVRKIGDTLVEMGVDSKYVKNFFTEEFGGVSWDDSPGTGGSGNHGSGGTGSGSGSHGTGEIPGGGSGNHGSGGTGSGSGSHGTGYIPGGGSPDYWNFIDAWELLSKKYGEKVASILQEFGEDGLKLAEKYGDDLASIIDNLEPTEAKKAVSLINSYGDDALDLFKEGKSFDEVKKVVESGRKTATIIDYSYKFDRELANFNEGYEIKTTVDKDLILVQYSSDAPDASLCYWTTIDEANEITSLNDYMDKLALSKDWGNRNTVKVARIPAGTKVKYAVGTAREQLLITDPRPGGGIQYLFNQFDTEWITEVRSFSN
ncbi:hypothetical protein [uncultured Eubacterium sp.]|uniref:hypothetical protein n=1 Tax=uncultured Eubacterium sp. TaxID=165185 RepID=UPI00260A4CD5|nr:hypothetical protein [uncultured Eubacterium sp.]